MGSMSCKAHPTHAPLLTRRWEYAANPYPAGFHATLGFAAHRGVPHRDEKSAKATLKGLAQLGKLPVHRDRISG
jgi:hypothetical protein